MKSRESLSRPLVHPAAILYFFQFNSTTQHTSISKLKSSLILIKKMNLTSPSSLLPDQDHHNHQTDHATSSFSYHIFFNESSGSRMHHPQHHELDGNYDSRDGSGSNETREIDEDSLKLSLLWKKDDHDWGENNPVEWMSKTKLMAETRYSDQECHITKLAHPERRYSSSCESTDLSNNATLYNNNSNNDNNNGQIRVCADCSTTKTPLWRSGPKGPKSLCNACGIRQRKARRAMAIAAAAAAGTPLKSETPKMKIKVLRKEKRAKDEKTSQHKKRFFKLAARASNQPNKRLGFEEYLLSLSKDLAYHRVFPQDEKEAAILLMALSSGFLHG